ncbi:hypothetical protein EV424DRAFT_1349231 [Suillus variegatus]|nr:hypothetical protein EV424DRAFT_1349231 [Suillus variegatus]
MTMLATSHGRNPNPTPSFENSCTMQRAKRREIENRNVPRWNASEHTSTWASSTSTSVPHRTASLPGFSTPSTSTLASTLASNSSRKLHPMKLISKKVPPLHAYSSTAPVKDGVSSKSELAARYLHIIHNGTAEMDENSRRKQAAKVKAEKEAASGTLGDIATRKNTCASSSGSRSTSTAFTARPLKKTASISSTSSAPLRGNVISDFTPNESFSMHVDDVLPPPKRAVGRTPSIVMDTSPTASSSNSGFMPPSKTLATASTSASTIVPEKITQSRHVVAPSATQRGPPPLGMRRQHNLPNSGFPLSQLRYATTQSPYAASQAKGQKPVTLPPFKPPLLKKPNSIPTSAPKQVFQTPESPPTSTPELVKDDSNDDSDDEDKLGAAGADSSFDVSFDVDVDALEATMRQYG